MVTSENLPPGSWHFIGNAFSPCPFVLRMDAAFVYRPPGTRGRHGYGNSIWCLWLFGWVVPILDDSRW